MLIGFLVAIMAFGTITVFAATVSRTIEVTYGVSVVVDGTRQDFAEDMLPFVSDGRTFLPVRGIADALGLDVDWDGVTSTVYLTSPVVVADIPPTTEPPTTTPATTNLGVTRAAYERITYGMTVSEVQAIIGRTPFSDTTETFGRITARSIMWFDTTVNAGISVIFANGRVEAILQVGL